MSETEAQRIEAAKDAMSARDWGRARRLLAPMVAEKPHGVGALHLARTEFELGRPDVAAPLIAAFRSRRPEHVGARLLAARVHLAAGELSEAEAEIRAARELDPDRKAISRLMESIEAARDTVSLDETIGVLGEHRVTARDSAPSPEAIAAARVLHNREPGPNWADDTRQATIAYFHHATDIEWALRNYDPRLIDISARFEYIVWPKRIQDQVRGKRVLDVGCGFGAYGMGFMVAGATEYTGIDPAMDVDSPRARNKRTRSWDTMGVTPRQIEEALPAIRLIQSAVEDVDLEKRFDTVALHNVTEHFLQLEKSLAAVAQLCHEDTNVVFHHHNYYSWNGHHLQPNRPEQFDESDPSHREIADWRHINIVPDLPPDHSIITGLNRVRLDEFRSALDRHFDIVGWEEMPSPPSALDRLTPEVVERVREAVPDITERELTTKTVLGVAKPKP